MNARNPAPFHSRLVASFLSVVTLCCLSLLTGCNSGGDDATTTTTTSIAPSADAPVEQNAITGVAAIGRPLDGYVYIQDAAGIVVNAPIAADGTYQADISGMLPPFIVRVQASDGRVWYSYAPAAIPTNVSQLTTLVVFLANGKADLDTLFARWAQQHETLTYTAVLHAQMIVNLNLSGLFDANDLDTTQYNFFTTHFTTNGTGFDAALDSVGQIYFANGTYQFSNPQYSASFDETPLPGLDPGEFDILATSLAYNAQHTAWTACNGTLVLSCPIGAHCTIITACGNPPGLDMSEPLPGQNWENVSISIDGSFSDISD